MKIFSVIIPVYNVEKYLKKCLDSILNQTFQNFEIICVYDISEDKTFDILKEYEQKDDRIIITKNFGNNIASARNSGMKVSSGEYFYFVDSDDWLEPTCLEKVYNKFLENNADIVFFCSRYIKDNKVVSDDLKLANLYLQKKQNEFLIDFMWTCWNKIFKRDFIINNNIKFFEDVIFSEDGLFNLICLYKTPKIECIPEIFYNYIYLKESSALTRNDRILLEKSTLEFLLKCNEFKNVDDEMKILSVNKLCKGILNSYLYLQDKGEKTAYNQLCSFINFAKKNVDIKILNQCHNFIKIKQIRRKFFFRHFINKFW